MNVLFVTPNPAGSGEALTAHDMARHLLAAGHEARFLSSRFTAGFLETSFPRRVELLTGHAPEDRRTWRRLLRRTRPDLVVFADYPLLHLSARGRALIDGDDPLGLAKMETAVVTLDHLGLAQGPLDLPFGPPHLAPVPAHLPAIPEGMEVLLPCPVHGPDPQPGRRGQPFRYWHLPFEIAEESRREVRRRHLRSEDEVLVFHSIPTWALDAAHRHGLPHYRYLTRFLELHLEGVERRVTLVSVNRDHALPPASSDRLRIVNLHHLAPAEYRALLLASDAMLTDNGISVSLGRAVCGLVPCALLENCHRLPALLDRVAPRPRSVLLEMERERPGAVFPFHAFPLWSREDLRRLGFLAGNPLTECVVPLELFDPGGASGALGKLLTDGAFRRALQSRQRNYVASIRRLPGPVEALSALVR